MNDTTINNGFLKNILIHKCARVFLYAEYGDISVN